MSSRQSLRSAEVVRSATIYANPSYYSEYVSERLRNGDEHHLGTFFVEMRRARGRLVWSSQLLLVLLLFTRMI